MYNPAHFLPIVAATALLTIFTYCFSTAQAQGEPIDLSISQTVFPATSLLPNQPVVYSIFITNHSAISLSNVIVTDIIQSEAVSISVISTSKGSHIEEIGGYPNFRWQIDNLAPKTRADIYIIGRIAEDLTKTLTINNVAEVYAEGDLFLSNNHATVNSRVFVPKLLLADDSISVQEANTQIELPVRLDLVNPYGSVSVDYSITPAPETPGAMIPNDLAPVSGTLFFTAATADTDQIIIEIFDDLLLEEDERFRLELSSPRGAALGETSSLFITIEDDEPATQSVQSVFTQEDVSLAISLDLTQSLQSPITITIHAGPTNGQLGPLIVASSSSATITYTPTANFAGQDEFTYLVMDDIGQTTAGLVEIMVTPVNDPPTAANDSTYSFSLGETLEERLVRGLHFIDADVQDRLTIDVIPAKAPDSGDLVLYSDGAFHYVPKPGFVGSDSFGYHVCDDGFPSLCATGEVFINVEPVNIVGTVYVTSNSLRKSVDNRIVIENSGTAKTPPFTVNITNTHNQAMLVPAASFVPLCDNSPGLLACSIGRIALSPENRYSLDFSYETHFPAACIRWASDQLPDEYDPETGPFFVSEWKERLDDPKVTVSIGSSHINIPISGEALINRRQCYVMSELLYLPLLFLPTVQNQ